MLSYPLLVKFPGELEKGFFFASVRYSSPSKSANLSVTRSSTMKRRSCLFVILAVALPGGVRAQGTIEGTVKLPARAPEPIAAPRYALKSGVVAPPEPPVAVVYLEGNFAAGPSNTPPNLAQMGQRNFQFTPGLLPIQKGTRVEFPNLDDDYHNVFSYSKIKRFDLGRYRKEEKPAALVFDQPGAVRLRCEIHEHMRGTILVLDTPYFTKTDTNGVYRLENLPAGNFVLKAWVDEKTVWQQPVAIKAAQTTRVEFPVK